MTLNEAIFDLYRRGLPYPSPFSVFFLYEQTDDFYQPKAAFDLKFSELLAVQQTIQQGTISHLFQSPRQKTT